MWEDLNTIRWAIYPAKVVLCFMVVVVYGHNMIQTVRRHGWDEANIVRAGILFSFTGLGLHAAFWGIHLFDSGDRSVPVGDLSYVLAWWGGWATRVGAVIAALLHLWAVSRDMALYGASTALIAAATATALRVS